MVRGSFIFLIFLMLMSCSPTYMKNKYSMSSPIDNIEVTFYKNVVTEHRIIQMECEEMYFIFEKTAKYSKIKSNFLCVDSIVSYTITNAKGDVLFDENLVYENRCFDSFVKAYVAHYNKTFIHDERLNDSIDKKMIIDECILKRSFIKKNDTIYYNKRFPKFLLNANSGIVTSDSVVDTLECIRFVESIGKH